VALVGFHVPSVMAFGRVMAENAGILIQPATMLGGDDQHMRVGFGRTGFGKALTQFERYLGEK
jgi:hypothetical protein